MDYSSLFLVLPPLYVPLRDGIMELFKLSQQNEIELFPFGIILCILQISVLLKDNQIY